MWPHAPVRVQSATTLGRLFDLGSYPALVQGNDRIGGELWHVQPDHLPKTLDVLDEIECYGIDDVDLYVRRIVECVTSDGRVQSAHAYFLADREPLREQTPLAADDDGVCIWRRYSTSS